MQSLTSAGKSAKLVDEGSADVSVGKNETAAEVELVDDDGVFVGEISEVARGYVTVLWTDRLSVTAAPVASFDFSRLLK